MSNSMNKVILMGHLGDAAEVRQFPSGDAYITFRLCTDDPYKDPDTDTWQTRPEWHNVKFTGKAALPLAPYLTKGSRVMVEGRIRTRSYEADGITKYFTEVRARDLILIQRKQDPVSPPEPGRSIPQYHAA